MPTPQILSALDDPVLAIRSRHRLEVLLACPLADEGPLVGMVLEREDEVEIGGGGATETNHALWQSAKLKGYYRQTVRFLHFELLASNF